MIYHIEWVVSANSLHGLITTFGIGVIVWIYWIRSAKK